MATITLRNVRKQDSDMLLRWKNEADTRKNSIVTDKKIKKRDHLRWFKQTIGDKTIQWRIIKVNGKSVGDVRVNDITKQREISIRMDKRYRGMGIATQVIALFPAPLTAKIRTHNVASMRVFIANGFRPVEYREKPVPYIIFKK